MPTLLHIDSSLMGEASLSHRLTKEFVHQWRSANPHGRVISRDLAQTAIPVIDAAWVRANQTPKSSRTAEQNSLLALSTEFIQEMLDADEYVLGVPMYNWGPSSSFKLWLDQTLRFGETIVYTASGPKGLLDRKRATFLITAGATYTPGSEGANLNYLEPWLRTYFGYLGVQEMHFLLADGAVSVLQGRVDREAFLAPHLETIQSFFAGALSV
jgi:FMN-dependent NADH-azoreductase